MTANRRIFLNIVATYGRSLYALVIGLFCGRWTLMALGQSDYGLVGVVGGLTGFVSFFNGLLACGVSRYYAFSVGGAMRNPSEKSFDECVKWFNTALCIHTIVPVMLVLIGYPAGEWMVRHYLTIPLDRIEACVWVWRFSCISCFISMINVPFQAMYTAKQEIAELTVYSFFTTTFNALFLYYMISHPGFWLVRYSAWSCCLFAVPQLIILVRAAVKYRECRFVPSYWFEWWRIRELVAYVSGRFFCAIASMMGVQVPAVMVNKMLGSVRNAAMTVGSTLSGQCLTLATSITGAFHPAITQAAGAREYDRMRKLMYVTCSVSTVAVMFFSLPLCLESTELLHLWLKNPPALADRVCLFILVSNIFGRMSDGLWMGILAMSKAFAYQTIEAVIIFMTIPFVYIMIKMGLDVVSVSIAGVLVNVIANFGKVYFARRDCGVSARYWILKICLPVCCVAIISIAFGMIPRVLLSPSLFRVFVTSVVVEIVFLPLAWKFVMPEEGRQLIVDRVGKVFKKKGSVNVS